MHTPPASGSRRGEVLEHLGERRHRVAREEAAARRRSRRAPALRDPSISTRSRRWRSAVMPVTSVDRPASFEAEHLEHEVGAHVAGTPRTRCTRDAARGSGSPCGSPRVDIVEHVRRARRDAELAALAVLDVDGDGAAALDRAWSTSGMRARSSQAGNAFAGRSSQPGARARVRWPRCAGCGTAGSTARIAVDERVACRRCRWSRQYAPSITIEPPSGLPRSVATVGGGRRDARVTSARDVAA